jgi:hypothetical protein
MSIRYARALIQPPRQAAMPQLISLGSRLQQAQAVQVQRLAKTSIFAKPNRPLSIEDT